MKISNVSSLINVCQSALLPFIQALTEVKESLSKQLSEKEEECRSLSSRVQAFEARQAKAREEEIQIAETKMMMHQVRAKGGRRAKLSVGGNRFIGLEVFNEGNVRST